jgi:hypothetical protein
MPLVEDPGDALRPKTFAGLFGAAPSIALPTLLITLSRNGAHFAAVEGRSMIVGAFALAACSWMVCLLLLKIRCRLGSQRWCNDRLDRSRLRTLRSIFRTLMIVQLNLSALRETRWYDYAIRFVLGGAMTVFAGLIAARFGPVVGGLFLAFRRSFPQARR